MPKKICERLSAEERFWSKVSKNASTGCWEWTAGFFQTGYGQFWFNTKNIKSHRFSYELLKGPIPQGMCILHSCDNRKCCNPNHLSIGTRADNNKDKINKNRQAKGSKINTSKLNENQVRDIKNKINLGIKLVDIAKQYRVDSNIIYRIKNGNTWAHVE